jgi:outer membrane protein OmpA-like peptidoglycan-associated protein
MRILLSILVGATVAATSLTASSQAFAQSKSADDIIKALKPSGTIGSGTRGIRPASAATAPAAEPAPAPVTTYLPQTPAPAPYQATTTAAPAPAPAPRPVTTAAASAPRPAAPAPSAAPSASLEVQFATGSADLTPQAREALDQLGRALSSADLAAYRFRIEGHTDTVGSPDGNRALSARRADVVVDYLNTKFGVARERMQPVGMGSDQLAVPTPAQVPEPRNRRVLVVNIGA